MSNWNRENNVLDRIKKKPVEYWLYFALLGVLFLAYIAIGFFATRIFENGNLVRDANFGFNQLKAWRFRDFFLMLSAFSLLWIFSRPLQARIGFFFDWLEAKFWRLELFIALFAIVMTAIFFAFSTNLLNKDGRSFQRKFERDVPTLGAHVTHDEMWELYFHSRFWFHTNQAFGWDVRFSYRVLSSLAGGVFVYALSKYARQRFGKRWFVLTLLICAGGYIQLFSGDVENYTLTAALIFLYLWSADEYIRGKIPLVVPSFLLAVALTFHLLSGFFLPSLAYLYFLALRRGQFRSAVLGFALSTLVVASTLFFFAQNGLPLRNLWTNSFASGQGGRYAEYLVSPSLDYYSQILNLIFLLIPAFIFLFPLLLFKRIRPTETNLHLWLATAGALILTFGWKAQLGVYNDWNLFAVTALPISLLVWNNFETIQDVDFKNEIAQFAAFVFFLHALTWIASNHLAG